ncbi:MAG: GDP-mannose 4,6-dehydratase, partial [Dehalococcoidia bacterium]|nr:GDP-mannose 4,6-dehydratase [Dehalococcoidia bacterium]
NVSDVRDQYAMNYLVQGKDYIFNLAGTLSHVDSMRDPFTDLEINCRSQLSILESCRLHNPEVKILFAGTRGQYGRADYLPVDEKHPMHPTDVNGINNMAGEWYHILYNNVYGIRATSLRLSNTYGPRHQMKHPRQGIINWFVRLVVDEEPINIFGDGEQIRDTNYVDDVVEAFLLAAVSEKADGEVFNLGGYPAGLVEIVDTLIDLYGGGSYALAPFPPNSKAIEIGDYVADWRKIKDILGWEPKVSMRDGLKRTIEYYVEHRAHYWKKGVVQ